MIVVTGASGFVGAALLQRLAITEGRSVRGVARRDARVPGARDAAIVGLGDFTPQTEWSAALRGATAVVHCAARVHVMDDREADPLEAFRRMNVEVTLALARQAVAAGVRRFVFVSSIKVNGEVDRARPGRSAPRMRPRRVIPTASRSWRRNGNCWRSAARRASKSS